MPNVPPVVKQRKPVAVLYGASTSHARAIAQRIADNLRAQGFLPESHDLQGRTRFNLSRCVAAVLLAPFRQGQHEQAVVDFVKEHKTELDRLPVAFLSVAVDETGVQAPADAPGRLGQFEGDVQMAPNPFFAETGWHPKRVKSLAGAISYTRYNFFVGLALRLLAKKGGAGKDVSRGYQNTDWNALDVFVNEFAREIRPAADDLGSGSPT